ncbi:MAG: phage tail protein [Sporomusaceae bacterium]|nr:phage tail protein [Sporomusaceae bacterium]
MAFNGMTMTTKGVTLQTKVQAGATLAFTKIKLGDGTLPVGGTLEALTDLVSPKLVVNIESVTSLEDGTWRVRGTLTNTGLVTGFFVREVGLFGTDPDDGEVLYSVANAGSQCDYLPAGGGAVVVEQVVDIVVAISSSATVTATINEAAVFVSLATMLEMLGLYLPLAGGTMSGAIAMDSNKVTGLADGTTIGDAVHFGQFANTAGASGYQKLPGGKILQWGTTGSLTHNTPATVTFPMAFPTACRGFFPCINGDIGTTATSLQVTALSASQATVKHIADTSASANYFYLAIGE